MRIPLKSGDRVGIIGGGPAGSFSALHLLQQARRRGINLAIQIFEPRDFNRPGPAGCNRCAGILSSRLMRGLDSLKIVLPPDVSQTEIRSYAIHLDEERISIQQPDKERRIVSIYRGRGPRLENDDPPASFDAFLLQMACARGATHIPHRAHRVSHRGDRPVIHTRQADYQVDFLVLATGINSRSPLDASFAYQPPRSEPMAQDEIPLPAHWTAGEVRAYFRPPDWLTFGALIPKGRFLNISLLGKHIPPDGVRQFLASINLPMKAENPCLCGCQPRIAVRAAKNYFGNRWVAVGDAAVTRLYKDGIGAAFYGAQTAMHTAVDEGIHQRAFERHYQPDCRRIERDNAYGRALYALWRLTLRAPFLRRSWARTIKAEQARPPRERIHERVLWGMLTGDEPYRSLLQQALSPRAVVQVLLNLFPSSKVQK